MCAAEHEGMWRVCAAPSTNFAVRILLTRKVLMSATANAEFVMYVKEAQTNMHATCATMAAHTW